MMISGQNTKRSVATEDQSGLKSWFKKGLSTALEFVFLFVDFSPHTLTFAASKQTSSKIYLWLKLVK